MNLLLRALIGFAFFMMTNPAFAIPEQHYDEAWRNRVLPQFSQGKAGNFTARDGVRIAYRLFDQEAPRACVVLLPGRTESVLKYAEVIFDLQKAGFSVAAMDLRGQGASQRLLPTPLGHVEHFEDYITDYEQFIREIVIPHFGQCKRVALAHSLGGAITTAVIQRNPDFFLGAALSAPMYQVRTNPYPERIAQGVLRVMIALGKANQASPDRGDYQHDPDFEHNEVTHSSARFEMNATIERENPGIKVDRPTVRWVSESIRATQAIRKNAESVSIPLLIFQAEADRIVRKEAQTDFCSRARHCERVPYAGAYHEILMEKDEVRNDAMTRLQAFFSSF